MLRAFRQYKHLNAFLEAEDRRAMNIGQANHSQSSLETMIVNPSPPNIGFRAYSYRRLARYIFAEEELPMYGDLVTELMEAV